MTGGRREFLVDVRVRHVWRLRNGCINRVRRFQTPLPLGFLLGFWHRGFSSTVQYFVCLASALPMLFPRTDLFKPPRDAVLCRRVEAAQGAACQGLYVSA